jgi:glutamate 2,3-aminomutase
MVPFYFGDQQSHGITKIHNLEIEMLLGGWSMDKSVNRFAELFSYIEQYQSEKDNMNGRRKDRAGFNELKNGILDFHKGTTMDWDSWEWQMANRFIDPTSIINLLNLTQIELQDLKRVVKFHRMAISPFLLALLGKDNKEIAAQFLPAVNELEYQSMGELDPMSEEETSPVPHVTQRYPDRLILNVTNVCGSYCRFCQRRRCHGVKDLHVQLSDLEPAFNYIKKHREIRDVLVTGGDPLTLSDRSLFTLLKELRQIPSVEIIRLGTRMPVVIPQRITEGLVKVIREFAPVYVNIHVNHPNEVSSEMAESCHKLLLAGAVLGSQTVLLKGVNDSANVLRFLFQLLLAVGVKPYYLFHAKNIVGTGHFRTTVKQGLELIESLRGVTTGLAIPEYVVNMTGGLGKVNLRTGANVSSLDENPILFKTWENKIVPY